MSDLLRYVPLPHPRRRRRVPRQVRVGATCLTVGCRYWRADMFASLDSCPDCKEPLHEIRSVNG
jgi:hypothetical protein